MPIAGYTLRLMKQLADERSCSIRITGRMTETIARSRMHNAASRIGTVVRTERIGDTVFGYAMFIEDAEAQREIDRATSKLFYG
jgi:hypothetical protein